MVVEKVENKHDEISLPQAQKFKPDVQIGEELEVQVTPRDFGRIAAQTAKQAIMQRIRQAEKEMIYDEFKDRAGEIVSGTVRRFERSDVIVDLGKFEAIMPIPRARADRRLQRRRPHSRLCRGRGERPARPGDHPFPQPPEFRAPPV